MELINLRATIMGATNRKVAPKAPRAPAVATPIMWSNRNSDMGLIDTVNSTVGSG